jgi:hypothetical protein
MDSSLPCPSVPSGHPFSSLPARADSLWSPGLELVYPGSPSRLVGGRMLGLPSSRVPPVETCPALGPRWCPDRHRRLAGWDVAFRAGEHVGSTTTTTRFRGSMPRPVSSLLLAPHDGLLRRTQDSLPACRRALAGWDYQPLFWAEHPLGNIGEFPVMRVPSPRALLGATPCEVRSRCQVRACAGAVWCGRRVRPLPLYEGTLAQLRRDRSGNTLMHHYPAHRRFDFAEKRRYRGEWGGRPGRC